MSFNSKLIQEIQQKSALSRKELSKMLRISDNQLYRIEKGLRQPSFSLLQRISALIGLPIDMLIERNIASLDDMEPEIGGYARENVTLKRDLERKREELLCAQKYIAELEREAEHSRAIINLQVRSGDIWCDDALTRGEKMKKLEILAIAAIRENEASFTEIRSILRVKRALLRKWIDSARRIYKCRVAVNGEILAYNPGEAALRLRCFDCNLFASGKCEGHGSEKSPDNIIELITRLEECGVFNRGEQARIITDCYDTPISRYELADVIYRHNNGLPIPESLFYLDGRGRKK